MAALVTSDLVGGDRRLFVHAGLAFGGEELEPLAGVPMSEDQVLELAQAMTALDDWGDDITFRTGLGILIESFEDGQPPPRWRHAFRRQLVHILNQRLHLRCDELEHPEIIGREIDAPLVAFGLPRSGTTVMHELLALAPDARAPLNWEYAAPWPAPQVATFATDPRISHVDRSWSQMISDSPGLVHMLPMQATMPSECNDALMFHFAGPNFWAWFRVPEHRRWIADQQVPGMFGTHRRILQQLQWKGPPGRWTLKSPGFVGDIEAIIEAYPDVRLVWTHRDPGKTIVSLASLVAAKQRGVLGEAPDPLTLGTETLDLWMALLRRGLAARRNPRIGRAILDVSYQDLVADKAATIARVHDHFGLEFSAEHERSILSFEQEQPSSHYAQHRYDAKDFGLDPRRIRDELADYYAECGEFLEELSRG